jgi:hypothetical protein
MPNLNPSGRKYFMHAAHATVGVADYRTTLPARQPDAGPDAFQQSTRPLRVCLLANPAPVGPDDSLAALKEHLGTRSIRVSRAFTTADSRVRGFERLDRCDCLVLLGPATIDGASLAQIDRFCRHGGAVVGLDVVGEPLEDGCLLRRKLFGVDCDERYERRAGPVVPAARAEVHPALVGVDPFVAQVALYRQFYLLPDVTTLLTTAAADRPQPVAWGRSHHGARIFCTLLGRRADWQSAAFRRLLLMALSWTTTLV